MTLAELESLAAQNNPTLAQAAARVDAARAAWLQAGLYPNPRAGYQASEINDEKQAGQQGGFFGQEIVTADKLKLSRAAAAQAVQQAQCAWAAQRGRVENDVRRAFYDVLVAQHTIDLANQLVRVGQEGVRAADELFKAKEVSRVDVLQARIEADTARIMAQKARNRHVAAWRNLAVVVGLPDMPPAALQGDVQDSLPQLTWEESLDRITNESPMLAEARAGVARAEAVLCRECAERTPNVDLQAGVQYDNATRDAIAGVQVGMPLPVFNRNQGNIRRAEAELVAARGETRRVALQLQQQLAAAFEQYQNARYQVEKYAEEILPNAQTSLNLVTAGYRQGEFNYVTLLTAQRTFFQVNLAYVEAVRDLRWASVAIEGNLLEGSLQPR
jgi:outer membrane protein, heavy metal efflux system